MPGHVTGILRQLGPRLNTRVVVDGRQVEGEGETGRFGGALRLDDARIIYLQCDVIGIL